MDPRLLWLYNQELGHVRRDGDERYSMTMRLFAMGSRALDHLDLFSLARPIAQALGDELGERPGRPVRSITCARASKLATRMTGSPPKRARPRRIGSESSYTSARPTQAAAGVTSCRRQSW